MPTRAIALLLLLLGCTGKAGDSARPVEDPSVPDTSYEPSCTCDHVCGELICASCGGCDDNNVMVGPWCDESCNGIDDNCNESIDEGVEDTYYRDADEDGWGDASAQESACDAPSGYVALAGDCDDTNPSAWVGAPEACGDGVDQDCDGADATCR